MTDLKDIVQIIHEPDTSEEQWIKRQLYELQMAYQREAKPLLDRLTHIQKLKGPGRIIVVKDLKETAD